MERTQKAKEVEALRDRFERMMNAIVTDYRGMDVAAMNDLRQRFREANVEFKVVKNTLVKRAIADQPYADALAEHLREMTAIAWTYDDPSAAAKVIRDFTKQNDKLKVKCGVMDGQVSGIEGWADMPSHADLLAMIVGQMVGSARDIVAQLMRPAQDIVSLIEAWKEKLEEDQGATE